MPQIVSCPDCGRPLNVPDHLFGRNVKCPGCGKKFLADVGAPDDRGRSGRGAAFVPRPTTSSRRTITPTGRGLGGDATKTTTRTTRSGAATRPSRAGVKSARGGDTSEWA